jgi:hypothetical protein
MRRNNQMNNLFTRIVGSNELALLAHVAVGSTGSKAAWAASKTDLILPMLDESNTDLSADAQYLTRNVGREHAHMPSFADPLRSSKVMASGDR